MQTVIGRVWAAFAVCVVLSGASSVQASPVLHSPWDTPVATVSPPAGSTCSTPPSLPADIEAHSYYTDPAHSVIDPEAHKAYAEATRPWHDAAETVDGMADRYRTDGDPTMALCTAVWLDRMAQDGAMTGSMTTNQETYVQGWMLGSFAMAWLKVRVAAGISDEQRKRITDWLAGVASSNLRYYERRETKGDGKNNHRYWAGMAVMAAGIAANNSYLFDWGIDSYRIGAAQIAPDGTLPLEMARASRALHYHLFAAAPLVIMAEIANANGVDLYGVNDGALARLVRRAAAGINDPAFFDARAGIQQEPVKLSADDLAWAVPFARRYPDPALSRLLNRLMSRSMLYIGGLPPP